MIDYKRLRDWEELAAYPYLDHEIQMAHLARTAVPVLVAEVRRLQPSPALALEGCARIDKLLDEIDQLVRERNRFEVALRSSEAQRATVEEACEHSCLVRRERDELRVELVKAARARDEARAKLAEAETLPIETDALRTMLLVTQRELDAIRDRHRTYAAGIAQALEPVRTKRETGEPARSDREEIEALVRERVEASRTAVLPRGSWCGSTPDDYPDEGCADCKEVCSHRKEKP